MNYINSEALFSIILTLKILIIDILLLISLGNLIVLLIIKENNIYKKILSFLVDLPLALPPIITGFILLWIFSKSSLIGKYFNELNINIIFNLWGLVLAGFIASLPLYTKPIVSSIKQFPKNVIEASYISGKGKIKTFIYIIIPNIKKVFLTSILLSISRIVGEVGISLMIGGNIPYKTNTISLEIFASVFDGDLKSAFKLSIILFIFSILIYFTLKKIEKEKFNV